MTDTPPGSADQGEPQEGGPSGRRWPDRPEYGQPTMPRHRPPMDQPGFGPGQAQSAYGQQPSVPEHGQQAGYRQQRPGDQPTQVGYTPSGYGQQDRYGRTQQDQYGQDQYGQTQYGQDQYGQTQYGQGQYGQGQYGQGQYGQQPA